MTETSTAEHTDRRATSRIDVHLPLFIYGSLPGGDPFYEETFTISINGTGGLILMATSVQPGTGEQYCAAFSHVYGLETVRLRYFNVFGPRQPPDSPYAAVIPRFIEAMLSGRCPVIHGDGLQSRDFTFVNDVIQANLLAAEAPGVRGKVYNVACGRRTSLLELVAIVNRLLGTAVAPSHEAPRPGDVRHSQADISRAQEDLGYQPQMDVEGGLRRCLEYYQSTVGSSKPLVVAA